VPWSPGEKEAFLRMQFEAQSTWYREQYVGATFDVIVVGGEPAGRLYVRRGEKEIRIIDIALLPEYRGSGIGTTLLRDLLAEADAAGKSTTIHVERMNPALGLYQRLGFAIAEDKGVYLLLERPPRAT
jgi:ribosomal protein S18 acetylase RimI-like enzyme